MEGLVVGIFPDCNSKALESALAAQQIDLSKVKVVCGNPSDTESSQLEFVDVIEDMESNSLSDDMTRGMGVIPDSGGTNVPGIGGAPDTNLESFSDHGGGAKRAFAGYRVPLDEVENFGDAVAEGRAVVLYPSAGADAPAIAAAFKAAGLRNVRSY